MANVDWIAQTVNTKGRPCPVRLADPCPGTRDGCAWWVEEIVTNEAGKTRAISGCLMAWQYVMGHEVTNECKRTQAALGQAATAVHAVTMLAINGGARGLPAGR